MIRLLPVVVVVVAIGCWIGRDVNVCCSASDGAGTVSALALAAKVQIVTLATRQHARRCVAAPTWIVVAVAAAAAAADPVEVPHRRRAMIVVRCGSSLQADSETNPTNRCCVLLLLLLFL